MRNLWLLSGLSAGLAAIALIIAIIALTNSAAPSIAPSLASPDKSNPTDYTVAFVRDAIRYYQENGRDATLNYYNSPASVDGPWYVFIYDENNIRIAHPTRPELLGLPVNGPTGVDITGYPYGQVMAQTTAEGQWVDYVFLNPDTGFQQRKHSWLVKHDGLIFGSGWYQGSPVSAADKSNPTDYAVSLVNAALRRYARDGREATVQYYNTPESVDNEWYVFIIDEQGQVAANADQSLLGQDLTGPLGVDITGYNFGAVMAATDENGQWVDYVFNNPDTGFQQRKHSWLIRRDGLIFGAGWYQGASVRAADKSNPIEYTVSLVDAALRRYEQDGRAATLNYYNTPESVDGDWYVFIIEADGRIAAHPDQTSIGADLKGDLGIDIAQYRFGDVILAVDEDGDWVDYMHLNRVTGNYEFKQSWVVRRDDLLFGAGWYQVVPPLGITKADPRAYAVSQVEQATELYQSRGRDAALAYYNSPESVDNEWYVFIIDEQGKIAATVDPALVGQDLTGPLGVDITGYNFGEVMAAADENGQWVDYVFNNPDTGFQQRKHSWVIRHDGLIFGSGWYQGSPVRAADKSNPIEYTVSLVDAALRRYEQDGRAATLNYYNTPESVDGDWYVFIIEANGRIAAHPDQTSIGASLKGDLGIDIAQYRFGDVILAVDEDGDWVDYMHLNRITGNYEFKQSWVVRRDDLLFGAGWYQVVPPLGITKADPRAYAVAQVEQATELYQSRGRDAALAYYNSPENVDGSWYVFIIDENDQLAAHPNQALLGEDLNGDLGVDSAGYRFGAQLLAAPEEGHWVDYVYLNPASGNQEFKHTWAVRHDGLIFGAGWYQVLPNLSN